MLFLGKFWIVQFRKLSQSLLEFLYLVMAPTFEMKLPLDGKVNRQFCIGFVFVFPFLVFLKKGNIFGQQHFLFVFGRVFLAHNLLYSKRTPK